MTVNARSISGVLILLIGLLSFWVAIAPLAIADSTPLSTGAEIFELHCAGCHINGGNIIRRNKTLKLKALQRNGMDSIEAITEIVTHGKNNMSAYQERLTAEQIQTVAEYVLEKAKQDWKS